MSKIPKSFQLFATTYQIVFDNQRMDDQNAYGIIEHGFNRITLSDTYKGEKLSDDTILDTYYHEKVHAILKAMGKNELNEDEEFVEIFSRLLRQSDKTAKY